ncbi:MAG: hypothetical protein A2X61_04240 [Ignavibacteria bacterium GWB2_35_12]|nr:MAG: hypothetical protein A2X63_08775 [Ignavibacteria bacterium GWA2_35_8]OGU38890.1 MAG: hypothetical protein A2X61_04240 [Ignavibacteria bacterium GWB2_35_12]OGU85916.1 MAG: hypothetical protein A2220_04945 [Ignavibacteria bacterium RIFOXYA2_FULL_35_10]OGV20344.1 MAG: hypothetical protein A2475_12015 [Ignavibacteria bacterium RIFOXYC2_FULL_35_21]
MKIIKSKNKNYWSSISILIILSILFSLSSCHNIRYTTKKWDVQRDLVNLNSKNNINVLINIESLNDSLLLIKTYTKDSVMIAREILPKKNLSQIDSTCQYLGLQCIGENRYWYPNGKIKKIINLKNNNQLDGELIIYYKNGQIKRLDNYIRNELKSGKCFDSLGNEVEYFPYLIEPYIDLGKFQSALIYPENMRRAGIEEKIVLRVLLDTLGTPVKIRYDSDNSIYFVNEIIRVFQNNKLFIPAKIDGYPEFLWVTIPVNFLLRIF